MSRSSDSGFRIINVADQLVDIYGEHDRVQVACFLTGLCSHARGAVSSDAVVTTRVAQKDSISDACPNRRRLLPAPAVPEVLVWAWAVPRPLQLQAMLQGLWPNIVLRTGHAFEKLLGGT